MGEPDIGFRGGVIQSVEDAALPRIKALHDRLMSRCGYSLFAYLYEFNNLPYILVCF